MFLLVGFILRVVYFRDVVHELICWGRAHRKQKECDFFEPLNEARRAITIEISVQTCDFAKNEEKIMINTILLLVVALAQCKRSSNTILYNTNLVPLTLRMMMG
jgi:hypothetical protein